MGPSLRGKLMQIHSLCKEPTKKKIGNIKALLNMDSFKVMAHSVFLKIKATATLDGLARDSLTVLEHYRSTKISKQLRVTGMPES
jgi:hypothetical protein